MSMRGAQHVPECHTRQHDVADVAAAAPEQSRILEPGYALANREFTHFIASEISSALAGYRKAAACWLRMFCNVSYTRSSTALKSFNLSSCRFRNMFLVTVGKASPMTI